LVVQGTEELVERRLVGLATIEGGWFGFCQGLKMIRAEFCCRPMHVADDDVVIWRCYMLGHNDAMGT
jgi:hypothetical protein